MSPAQVRLGSLRAEVERDLLQIKRQLERARSVDPASSGPNAAYVALALDHAYQALEQILLAIERALRLPDRAGSTWHRALLADAASPIPGVRPEVIGAEDDWTDLLGFRHFLRHAYAAELDPERLRKNVGRLESALRATAPLIEALLATLDPSVSP